MGLRYLLCLGQRWSFRCTEYHISSSLDIAPHQLLQYYQQFERLASTSTPTPLINGLFSGIENQLSKLLKPTWEGIPMNRWHMTSVSSFIKDSNPDTVLSKGAADAGARCTHNNSVQLAIPLSRLVGNGTVPTLAKGIAGRFWDKPAHHHSILYSLNP